MQRSGRRQALKCIALATCFTAADYAKSEGARWSAWPAKRGTPALPNADINGALWGLADHAGRPVLLNFWASWCEPCRAEMQSLVALEKAFNADGLKVVTINFKESAETVRRFRDAQHLPFMCLRDSYGEVARAWGISIFPSSVLINRKGHASLTVVGEVDWADAAVQQRLAAQM
jgi:thiol-disulfide isomerase/thioredoxin